MKDDQDKDKPNDVIRLDSLGERMDAIKRQIANDPKFRQVDFNRIRNILESALRLKPEDKKPDEVLEAFDLEVYIGQWMPPGEIWLFDPASLEDSVNLFASVLLAGVRGAFGFMTIEWTTETVVDMFQTYMAAQAGGRIVGLPTSQDGGIDWPKTKEER
jgi:hypothetical protein